VDTLRDIKLLLCEVLTAAPFVIQNRKFYPWEFYEIRCGKDKRDVPDLIYPTVDM